MRKFEYKILEVPAKGFWSGGKMNVEELVEKLNALGAQGWEVINTTNNAVYEGASTGELIILKREKS